MNNEEVKRLKDLMNDVKALASGAKPKPGPRESKPEFYLDEEGHIKRKVPSLKDFLEHALDY